MTEKFWKEILMAMEFSKMYYFLFHRIYLFKLRMGFYPVEVVLQ
jgi:hypothetical protein